MRERSGRQGGSEPGELATFEVLLERHREAIYRVAYRLAGNHDDAEDLVQDALYEAFRSFPRFRRGTRFDCWIFRIMTNRQIDRQRRRKRVSITSLDQPGPGDEEDRGTRELPDEAADPARLVTEAVLDETLQQALAELPVEYRQALILVDLEELSYEEAAAVARCPVGTIRSRLHRARTTLQRRLPHPGSSETSR